jgi:hypothetical protein
MDGAIQDYLSIPAFLDRSKGQWTDWPAVGHSAKFVPSRKADEVSDFRSRFPLTERDKIAITELEAAEAIAAKTRTEDRIAALKAKIKERQEKKATTVEPPSPVIKSKPSKNKDGELTDMVVHKRPGIIAAIMQMMQRAEGATQAEIHAELVKRFPDREAAGMLQTTKIQSRKLCSNVEEVAGRGMVFYMVVE